MCKVRGEKREVTHECHYCEDPVTMLLPQTPPGIVLCLLISHFSFSSGGQVGGPCPLDDSWIYSDNKWSPLQSCNIPSHSSSFVPLNSHSRDIGILYGGSQTGPGPVSQVLKTGSNEELSLLVVLLLSGHY